MKVFIDEVEYVPASPIAEGQGLKEALEIRFDSDAGENLTVREYLHKLLETLWAEGEGFSSKRPFGNSGWELDLFNPLWTAGILPCDVIENDLNPTQAQRREAEAYVYELINEVFFPSAQS